ncbi:Protein CBG14812 [Caenorhabditis briggsae]|uniref:Protein CBG14812 n=1 Tax=Caenorhabditis briggsae TaxID=6238 RepID=A8XKR1_CAEBR|nr:Protein CBG14812 [Caenorhabditis briggsae]CAP33235.2 Protein CBG14812 [Caenorhabditis briggsae]
MVLLAIYVGSQMTCNPVCTPPAFCDTNTGKY